MLKFLYNGIKVDAGKLEGCWYSKPVYTERSGIVVETITVYHNSHCGRFSSGVHDAFAVKNDTDSQTDYFESDTFRVAPDHPLYAVVMVAFEAQQAHRAKMQAKREARYSARRVGIANGRTL